MKLRWLIAILLFALILWQMQYSNAALPHCYPTPPEPPRTVCDYA